MLSQSIKINLQLIRLGECPCFTVPKKKKKKKIRKFPKRKFVKINVLNEFRTSHRSGWFFRNEEERVYFM